MSTKLQGVSLLSIEPLSVKLALATAGTGIGTLVVYAMSFTVSDLTALAAALAILLGAFFAGVVSIIKARADAKAAAQKLDIVVEKANAIIAATEVIGGHVNSSASISAAEIRDLRQQVEQLTRALNKSETTATVLAATTAVTEVARTVAAPAAPAAPATPSSLAPPPVGVEP